MGCLPPPYLPVVLVKGTERVAGLSRGGSFLATHTPKEGPIFDALLEPFKHHRQLAATQGVHQESLGNRGLTWTLLLIHPRQCQWCQPIVNGKHLWQVSHFARSQRRQLTPGAPFTLWPSPRLLSLLPFSRGIIYGSHFISEFPIYPCLLPIQTNRPRPERRRSDYNSFTPRDS